IKNLIARQGRLEFCILANANDDQAAITAARETLRKTSKEDQQRLEVRAEPPPAPIRDDGVPAFPVNIPNEPHHLYRWVELGKSQLYSLGRKSETLKRNGMRVLDRDTRELANVDAALKPGDPFELARPGTLYFARKIPAGTRRLKRDQE